MSDNDKHWFQLRLDPPVFNKRWIRPTPTDPTHVWVHRTQDVYDSEWVVNTHKMIDFPPHVNLTFFRRGGHTKYVAHTDVTLTEKNVPVVQNFGINWIEGGEDSEMIWYDHKNGNPGMDIKFAGKTPYQGWDIDTLVEKERKRLVGINLVRTDIPHAVCVGVQDRWCFSFRPRWNSQPTWEDVVRKLRSRGLIME